MERRASGGLLSFKLTGLVTKKALSKGEEVTDSE